MKKFTFILAFTIVLIGTTSCRPKVVKDIIKEYKALDQHTGIKYIKYKKQAENVTKMIEEYHSPKYHICNRCNGYGVLYLTNNGYPLLDLYGNFQFVSCDNCGGNGYVILKTSLLRRCLL